MKLIAPPETPPAWELGMSYQEKLEPLMWTAQFEVTPETIHSAEEGWTITRWHIRLDGVIKPDLSALSARECRSVFFQGYERIIDRLTALKAPFDGMPELRLTGNGYATYRMGGGYEPVFGGMKAEVLMRFTLP